MEEKEVDINLKWSEFGSFPKSPIQFSTFGFFREGSDERKRLLDVTRSGPVQRPAMMAHVRGHTMLPVAFLPARNPYRAHPRGSETPV